MPGKAKTPERNDVDPRSTWRLEDLFETEQEWEKAFSRAGEMIEAAGGMKGTLGESAGSLLKCLKLSDEMGELLGKVFVYAHMKSHQDTRDNAARAMADRATSLSVAASGAESFIMPEILAIPADRIEAFMRSEKSLEPYRFFLERIIRQRPHVLSEKEEALLAGSGEMANAPETIFSMLTNADMTFPDIVDEQGKNAPLTDELYGVYLQSRDRAVRKDAYEKLFDTYGSFKNTLAASYGATLRSTRFYASSRNYPSSLESSLFANNIPVSVYTSLLDAVHSRLDQLHRYVSIKKKALNLDNIAMYDLYVPLVEEPDANISWEKACEMVLEGLSPLGEEYCRTLSKGFSERWIDVYENRGKRSGAYSWGTWPVHPYVLLNFNGKIRDVFTLAHEMGHALHKHYSDIHQPFIYAGHSIFIAEVASTTNEALLLGSLRSKARNRQESVFLLNYLLEQIRTTVFRQTMFAEFEMAAHDMVAEGQAPTADTLGSLWLELNEKYYGTAIETDEGIRNEWSRIPHFYSPFYVYQYATGYSAATALSRGISEEGEPARKRYLEFLGRGESAWPIDVLKDAGVDMTSPEPVAQTLDLFKEALDELENLLG